MVKLRDEEERELNIAGTDIPMFMGAMMMGPLGGWTMKKIDAIWDGKIRPGFEMLVDNFSAGIWGMILAIFSFFALSPVVTAVSTALGATALTRIQSRPSSRASARVIPITAAFAAV